MAKKMNEEPKVRTRTRTDKSGVVRTKTVTKGKGYRKVEKTVNAPSGAYATSLKERKKTATGKKVTKSYMYDKEFPGAFGMRGTPESVAAGRMDYVPTSGQYSRVKEKTKRGAYSGKGPRKTVSSEYGVRYGVSAEGKAPSYTAYDTEKMMKEKGAKGKGKVVMKYEDMGYDYDTGKRNRPKKVTKTKGSGRIVSKLKKQMK